ncbi:MAG: helix-turn-helix domain-containing protein [Tabrizicola sp.]|nr:helix-turn-helix domain-containing protein [Tabrizicola sp.]
MKRQMPVNLLTAPEVADYFNVNVSTVWRWLKAGTLPAPVKIAGATRWRLHDIEAVTATAAA